MGGRTGGPEFKSEATLIAERITGEAQVNEEDESTNTLENIVKLLNRYPQLGEPGSVNDVLGSNYYIPRIKRL